jgi:hypothetical protein
MMEKHFYADADTPFHVWVRERCGAQGYRWVLRHASQVIESAGRAANAREATTRSEAGRSGRP